MKINYECLPCLVNQTVKVANMTNVENKEELFRNVFAYLSELDFSKTNPEIIGSTFRMLKEYIHNDDPYKEIRNYYNKLFLSMLPTFKEKIESSQDPFREAVKYAIVGNTIDFNPIHNSSEEDILKQFEHISEFELAIDESSSLINRIENAHKILYIGDNCGEICLDKLLLEQIKNINPESKLYFGVRGASVVNDSIEEDAYKVGINEVAQIVSNGDDSLGTVVTRTSKEFNNVLEDADVILAKGQANYESLSESENSKIYYLLKVKCNVISRSIGAEVGSYILYKS